MDKEMLTALWAESATANRDSVWSVKDTLKATAEAANMVTSSAAGKQIKQISVSLENMRVITMSHEDLINVRDKYLKGTCEEAVVLNLQSGAVVCQTAEVLQADMTYRMQFAEGLESMQKVALAKQAAASLDLTVDESRTDVMRGEELYYGVRLRRTSCFSLADNTDRFAAASHRTGGAVW
jgi:selenocysteine-specific translation elongation factor